MVALPCEPPLQLGGPLLAIAPLSARPPGLPMACEFLLTLSLLSFSFLLQTWRWCEASVSFSLLLGCAGSILWTTASLVSPFFLSLPHSLIHSPTLGCALFQGLRGVCHSPPQSQDSGHCSGPILSLSFSGRDSSWSPEWGAQACGPTNMAVPSSAGRPSQHTCPPHLVPGHCLSLLSLEPPFNLPAQPQPGRDIDPSYFPPNWEEVITVLSFILQCKGMKNKHIFKNPNYSLPSALFQKRMMM